MLSCLWIAGMLFVGDAANPRRMHNLEQIEDISVDHHEVLFLRGMDRFRFHLPEELFGASVGAVMSHCTAEADREADRFRS